MQEDFLFSTPSPAYVVCRFFDDGHSDVWNGDRDGREVTKGRIYVYIQLIHMVVQKKLAQHCKAVILH